jgi:hypothetical protein
MTEKVWMSSVYGNHQIGDKTGICAKHFYDAWMPAQHIQLSWPKNVSEAMSKNGRGHPASRQDMPEAAAVWDNKCFKRLKDVLTVSGYFVITGELVDVFKDMDFGEGGLVELPFYEADLVTPLAQKFFMINVGARKDAFLPEASENKRSLWIDEETGRDFWKVNGTKSDGIVSLSAAALNGPDLWVDVSVNSKLFMSDRLGTALSKTRHAEQWDLLPCQIVGAAS